MFFPKHQIREYCLYLGSLELIDGKKYDLGVYEKPSGGVSHAIVYGDEGHEYLSGDINFMSRTAVTRANWELYMQYMDVVKGGMPVNYTIKVIEAATRYITKPRNKPKDTRP